MPALLALSLGIGATTVIFSVVYSILVNAFPFPDSSRVVHFYIQTPDNPGRSAWYPVHEFIDYRAQNDVFSALLGGASLEVLYDLDNSTYRVRGALLDPQALQALGLRPALGRGLTDADVAAGAPPTFLMSDRMWNERFNRDPDVIGRTLNLNGTMRTLIAVLPPRFLLHGADVFLPTSVTPGLTNALIGGPGTAPLMVWTYGRLKPGVTPEQAAAHLEVLARNQARQYPQRYPDGFRIAVVSLADAYTATSIKELVYILVGAVVMLLMIAAPVGTILLRTSVDPRSLERGVREQIWAVDRGVALMNVMTLDEVVQRDALAAPRFGVGLMATFAAIGLILAAIGVFSVMSYTVSLQTHDIGIRMAHGAQPEGIVRMIVWKGLRPIVIGVVVGLGASYWLSRVMANQIYGVATTDPWTFTAVAAVLVIVAIAACIIPARRATRVNPLVALRGR